MTATPTQEENMFQKSELFYVNFKNCSHSIHSKVYAILGYIELLKENTNLTKDASMLYYLNRMETLSKEMLNDFHNSLDYFVGRSDDN